MPVIIGESERRVEAEARYAARIPESDRSRSRTLFGDVPNERDVLRFLRIGTRPDVGLDLRKEVERVETLVIAFDCVGVEDHAEALAQLPADHFVFGAGVAGDFDDGDPRDVDIVFYVGRSGCKVDRRGNDAALEVTELEVELVFV